MRRRPKTIVTGGGQASSGDATLDWVQTQQLSDQVCFYVYKAGFWASQIPGYNS